MAFKMKGHTLKGPKQAAGMRQPPSPDFGDGTKAKYMAGRSAAESVREQTPHLAPAKTDMARVKAGKEKQRQMSRDLVTGSRAARPVTGSRGKAESQKTYTKKEHETNKTNNTAIDNEMLAYKKAYSDLHGSSSGGSDKEYAAYQAGLTKLRGGYVDR